MNICPGCGRCRECGQPPAPPYIPYTPPTVEPYREPRESDFTGPFTYGQDELGVPIITCSVDGPSISAAVLSQLEGGNAFLAGL